MPPNGVLGFGLDSGGKAFAGDWGLLKAELSEVGNPCMLWVWEGAVPPRFKEPMPDRESNYRRERKRTTINNLQVIFWAKWENGAVWKRHYKGVCPCEDTCTGEMASRLLVLGARPFGITPGGGCRALFITLLQFATMVRIVSDSSWDTLLRKVKELWF